MAIERTLSIIKPDAVAKNVIGQIYSRFEGAGLKVVAARMAHLSRAEAEGFYAVHKARPFFKDLVEFMISGPVMIQALEGENAIAVNRELMGNIISQEVIYYKYNVTTTKTNMYGESVEGRNFADPVMLFALIELGSPESPTSDLGVDFTWPITFRFLKDDSNCADSFSRAFPF